MRRRIVNVRSKPPPGGRGEPRSSVIFVRGNSRRPSVPEDGYVSLSLGYEDGYPQLNQTTIQLQHTNFRSPSDTHDVILRHTMPWFQKFLVRINGADWKNSEPDFLWVLEAGENTIEAKAINLAGVEGSTSRIVLRDNITKKL